MPRSIATKDEKYIIKCLELIIDRLSLLPDVTTGERDSMTMVLKAQINRVESLQQVRIREAQQRAVQRREEQRREIKHSKQPQQFSQLKQPKNWVEEIVKQK